MRSLVLIPAIAIALSIAPAARGQTSTDSPCRPVDEASGRLLRWALRVATDTTRSQSEIRVQLQLPQVDSSQVRYVMEDSVCRRVIAPYDAETRMYDSRTGQEIAPSGELYVVRVAQRMSPSIPPSRRESALLSSC
jgi:hypothetical protein